MKKCTKELFGLSVLVVGLELAPVTPLLAQTLTTLHTFNGTNEGSNPYGPLILSSNLLFGTTYGSYHYTYGTIFAVSTNGSELTNLHSFTAGNDGANPFAGLTLSRNTLYGTTQYGGIGGPTGGGSIFTINIDGSGFTTLHTFTSTSGSPSFTNSDGAEPLGRLVLSGNVLYGTTSGGGSGGCGTIFAVNIDGTGFMTLHNFTSLSAPFYQGGTNGDGACPNDLILCGNTLYGTTQCGGSGGNGTVFGVGMDGMGFRNLHHFSAGGTNYPPNPYTNYDGGNPYAGLVLSGNLLCGTTSAGGLGDGTLFKVNTNGTGFTTLHTFTGGSDGAKPSDGLILSGSTLYGTTVAGGSGGSGTVFSINTSGNSFTTVYSFSAPAGSVWVPRSTNWWDIFSTNSDGIAPEGLILWGGTLYGATSQGGVYGYGTLFSIPLQPQLTITPAAGTLIVSWPTNAAGFTLQSSTNLASPLWATNLAAPVIVNGQYGVTSPISGTQQYFRLSQ